jgi:hypothetical protein
LKTTLITGCSWGCGEWAVIDGIYGLCNPGFAQFFNSPTCYPINLSRPAGNPYEITLALETFLKVNSQMDIDKIFYLQTDIGRSWSGPKISQILETTLAKNDYNFELAIEACYHYVYRHLNDIAAARQQKIYVIGGLTDVIIDFEQYKNLEIALDSWCHLLDPDLPLTGLVDVRGIDYLNRQFQQHQTQILPLIEKANQRWNFYNTRKDVFYPDGIHPNRYGHQLLFNYLKEKYNV